MLQELVTGHVQFDVEFCKQSLVFLTVYKIQVNQLKWFTFTFYCTKSTFCIWIEHKGALQNANAILSKVL